MFNRPFLPFRVRPVREIKVRPSAPQAADILAAVETLKPVAVKAERRSMRATPVIGGGRGRPTAASED